MCNHLQGRLRRQIDFLRQQFLQEGSLPFTEVLSEGTLVDAVQEIEATWKDRIFTPLVTLWVFLGQALAADQSCRAAVARLVGRNLDAQADPRWLWKGRRVCLFDGSTVSMPDTPENRREYPLTYNQTPGTNFAVARIGAVISLSCGAVLDLGVCRYAGKGQGEVSLLRQLWDVLRPGDVLLGDRLMSGWVGMYLLKQRGVDTVSRLSAHRRNWSARRSRPTSWPTT